MTLYDTVPALAENPIFAPAKRELLNRIFTEGTWEIRPIETQEIIFSPDMELDCVGLLLEGEANIHSADPKRPVPLRTIKKGAAFGIATLFASEEPFPTRIRSRTPCRVLFLDASAVRELITSDPAVNRAFLELLCERVVYLNKKIESFTAGSAERRLSLYLAENATDGTYVHQGSLTSLAKSLDIGRASLYRAFEHLEADGFLCKREKSVTLLHKEAMLEKYTSLDV